jgi:outer membrane murein-binding lipoprotein Lpp
MEKIKNFFSKHGLVAFIVLFLFMLMRGCVKNSKINRLEKEKTKLEAKVDSLNNGNDSLKHLIMGPEQKKTIEWSYGVTVYNLVNDEIFKLDRTEQMKSFQQDVIIKNRRVLTDSLAKLKNK